jgi:hypothetical protein
LACNTKYSQQLNLPHKGKKSLLSNRPLICPNWTIKSNYTVTLMGPNKYKIKISEKRGPFTSVRWDFRGPLKKDEISLHCHKLEHKHPRVEKVRLPHESNWAREMQIQLTKRSHGSPSLNMMKVGKASIRYLSAMLGYFSVSIFTTWILSFSWEATSLRTGAMNWQGPHLETRAWITHFQFNHILLINIC